MKEGVFGEREIVWRDRGLLLVQTFVDVQSDYMNRPSEGDGGISKGRRDRGRKGRIASGRKEEGAFGGR